MVKYPKSPEQMFDAVWQSETTDICKIQTYRDPNLSNEEVNGRIIQVRNYILDRANEFNENLTEDKFTLFQWCAKINEGATEPIDSEDLTSNWNPSDDDCKASDYWVFGLRCGSPTAKKKVAVICHLDTVPATEGDSWLPFQPHVEQREYEEGTTTPQNFLVGRGCVDDKGPAISAFIAARALALQYDGTEKLDNTVLEIIFDTSEETDMSTPHYMGDENTVVPNFGIVYDAQWCVRAEKGAERPVFQFKESSPPSDSIFIQSLITSPNNSTNTIPDWAEAVITGEAGLLNDFANSVQDMYESFGFDDAEYHRAEMKVTVNESEGSVTDVTLKTFVEGAQHGSAPEQNRTNGANPLVSLANFLAGLVTSSRLAINAEGTMAQFIRWTWGTHVFGETYIEDEDRPLYKFDDVFVEGNGTTYAVTKAHRDTENVLTLEIDIRYSIGHHSSDWDGETEGLLEGESIFGNIFNNLVSNFNETHSRYPAASQTTKTIFAPDIRDPDNNESFLRVEEAYEEVRGKKPERFAIGGGTDAKGFTFLLGVGPLMDPNMGFPINYHGIDEGAPIADMKVSTNILFHALSREIDNPVSRFSSAAVRKCLEKVKALRKNGYKHGCSCSI